MVQVVRDFEDTSGVRVMVKLTVKELIRRSFPYTDCQKLLFLKIVILRERASHTFKDIAEQLGREGYKSCSSFSKSSLRGRCQPPARAGAAAGDIGNGVFASTIEPRTNLGEQP